MSAMGLSVGMNKSPSALAGSGGWQHTPPIRPNPNDPKADRFDGDRIEYVRSRWHAQDMSLIPYHRQVEENVRMILGRQWDVWSPVLGQYVDVTRWMTEDERRWRQRPVFNKLLHWFMLTHARLTENPPIITFQPSTADRVDAMLSEAMDTIFKTLWHDTEMLDNIDRLFAVLVPGGQAFLKSYVDFDKGEPTYIPEEQQDGTFLLKQQKEGQIMVDVLNPLECRGEWGSMPWHRKRWHIHRSFLTPLTVYEKWGVDVPPDTFQATNTDGTGGYLTRMLFGSGYFGAAQNKEYGQTVQGMSTEAARREGYVTVDEMWEAPTNAIPDYSDEDGGPGGRLLIVTQNKVLWDSIRPYAFRYTSPIRCFTFVNVPGRPAGTSPQEMMNPLQKTLNRGGAQILEHRNLVCNPILMIPNASGVADGQITNRPGLQVFYNAAAGAENQIHFLAPPPLSNDVWKAQEWLSSMFDELGNVTGATGETPQDDASGELLKQLRYNSDRFIGATAKRSVVELVKMVQDWIDILPSLWTEQKVLTYVGDDDIANNLTIYPEMWEGNVRIIPDMDSMIPESRTERQTRIVTMYQLGAFGPPGSPPAANALLELSKFPHMNRASAITGGTQRITAQQSMGNLARGTPALQIPVFEWYDLGIWMGVYTEFMSSPEYLKMQPPVQQEFVMMLDKLKGAQVAQQLNMLQQQAPMAALHGAVANKVQQAAGPPPGAQGPSGPPAGGHGNVPPPREGALQPSAPAPINTPNTADAK